ncbi:unnamed protein product [Trichogramma brassicae]|uniref:Peptidase S1 domain-containing protein n=1 Tax=Trichogramma brassicae TaxID=86971 RepID=A0A6H5IFG1_9HYME|nr:unnamed protein product [Trichogramma brassicae]
MNGTLAAEGQFPYQVDLQWADDGRHFCGGSIINKRYILTAAHCVFFVLEDEEVTTMSPDDTTADYDFNPTTVEYESSDSTTESSNSVLENSSSESPDKSNIKKNKATYGLLLPKALRILAGVNKRDDENGIFFEAEKIIKHEYYGNEDAETEHADIALIRLKEDIEFNDKVQPVKLASSENQEDILPVDAPVYITGWGYTYNCMVWHEEQVNDLRLAKRKILDFNQCQQEYLDYVIKKTNETDVDPEVDHGMICSVGYQYSCMGDSGGPVVDERGVQVGVVSFSTDDLPDVHTSGDSGGPIVDQRGVQVGIGDSGGPVVNERGVQVGIVSFSEDLLPDVHTSGDSGGPVVDERGVQVGIGDSGGPIVDGRGVQVGIVSYSVDELPDVHTSGDSGGPVVDERGVQVGIVRGAKVRTRELKREERFFSILSSIAPIAFDLCVIREKKTETERRVCEERKKKRRQLMSPTGSTSTSIIREDMRSRAVRYTREMRIPRLCTVLPKKRFSRLSPELHH